jgi:hypothetical protein
MIAFVNDFCEKGRSCKQNFSYQYRQSWISGLFSTVAGESRPVQPAEIRAAKARRAASGRPSDRPASA